MWKCIFWKSILKPKVPTIHLNRIQMNQGSNQGSYLVQVARSMCMSFVSRCLGKQQKTKSTSTHAFYNHGNSRVPLQCHLSQEIMPYQGIINNHHSLIRPAIKALFLGLVQVDLWENLLLATDSHDLTIDTAEGPVTAHAQMLKAASPAPWLDQLPKKTLSSHRFFLKQISKIIRSLTQQG